MFLKGGMLHETADGPDGVSFLLHKNLRKFEDFRAFNIGRSSLLHPLHTADFGWRFIFMPK